MIGTTLNSLFDYLEAPDESSEQINWGHVGDVEEIRTRLHAVLDFIRGEEK